VFAEPLSELVAMSLLYKEKHVDPYSCQLCALFCDLIFEMWKTFTLQKFI
jgi:hypothetical protein